MASVRLFTTLSTVTAIFTATSMTTANHDCIPRLDHIFQVSNLHVRSSRNFDQNSINLSACQPVNLSTTQSGIRPAKVSHVLETMEPFVDKDFKGKMRAAEPKPSRFLSLPAELRQILYQHVLPPTPSSPIDARFLNLHKPLPNLLGVCRLLRAEVAPIYFDRLSVGLHNRNATLSALHAAHTTTIFTDRELPSAIRAEDFPSLRDMLISASGNPTSSIEDLGVAGNDYRADRIFRLAWNAVGFLPANDVFLRRFIGDILRLGRRTRVVVEVVSYDPDYTFYRVSVPGRKWEGEKKTNPC